MHKALAVSVILAACRGTAPAPAPASASASSDAPPPTDAQVPTAPPQRPDDFALEVRTFCGAGVGHCVKTIRVSARGGEVEDAGVPPVIVGRFSVSPAELDALFASYVAARVEDGSACHATWSDAATITIDATVRGQHHRGTRCEPDAGADALAAVLGLIAARAR